MLNLFSASIALPDAVVREEKWTLKPVQGDDDLTVRPQLKFSRSTRPDHVRCLLGNHHRRGMRIARHHVGHH